MPFNVSVSSRARRPVQAMASGGYQIADRVDPNDAIAIAQRANPAFQGGVFSVSPQLNSTNPNVTASGGSALAQNVALGMRGQANRQAFEQADRSANPFAAVNFVHPTIGADALLQALYESGADRVRSGASAGMDAPGFFDTQQRRMPFAMSASQTALLHELSKNPNYDPMKGRR